MKYYGKLWKHEKYFYIILMIAYVFFTVALCNLLMHYKEYIDNSMVDLPYLVFIGYVVILEFLKNYSKNNEPARNFIQTLPVKKVHIETFHYFFGLLTFLPSMLIYLKRITGFAAYLKREILFAMVISIVFFAVTQVVKLILKRELLALGISLFLYLCVMGQIGKIF